MKTGMSEKEALAGLDASLESLNRGVQKARTKLVERGADVLLGDDLLSLAAEVDRAYTRLDVLRMARN